MRIVVAIEEHSIRSAIGMLVDSQPDLQLVGEVDDVTDLLGSIKSRVPDAVVLDWDAFETKFATLQDLLQLFDERPLIFALSIDEKAREGALASGVAGFAYKGNPPSQLLDVIRETVGKSTSPDHNDDKRLRKH